MTRAHPIPDAALAAHLAILGKTGAGKSYAARSTVEGILRRGERACIVDPTGVWWGLRLGADGGAGFPVVIAGGRHGDVPLGEDDGSALARVVGGSSTPLILDVSRLTVGARTKLFTRFAEALLIENVGPLHLVLDEAHLFAPQTRVPDPQSAAMVHAANGLVALGRARGLRIMLLTQRPAKLHKDALTQVETLVAMRLVAPQDRKAVEQWIIDQADRKQGAEIVASLPTLQVGEAWIWSPDAGLLERAAFPAIATFDSMRPEAQGTRAPAPIDVAGIRAALVSHGAGKDENQRRPASRVEKQEASAAAIAAAEQRGYERGHAAGFQEGLNRILRISDEVRALGGRVDELLREQAMTAHVASPAPAPAAPAPSAMDRIRANVTRRQREQDASGLNSAGRKMLAILDTNPPVRRSWTQVATLAGLKARGGHFNAGKKGLTEQAWVEVDGDLVAIRVPSTTAGPAVLDPVALVETWAGLLSGAAPRILRHLFGVVHDTRANIARALALQPRGGHWNAAWKELRDNALIVESGDQVRLSDLFATIPKKGPAA